MGGRACCIRGEAVEQEESGREGGDEGAKGSEGEGEEGEERGGSEDVGREGRASGRPCCIGGSTLIASRKRHGNVDATQ